MKILCRYNIDKLIIMEDSLKNEFFKRIKGRFGTGNERAYQ